MLRSLKFLAALSLSALVFAAPVRAEGAPEGTDKPKREGDGAKKPGGDKARPGGPADRLQQLTSQLNLTEEQKKEIDPIILSTRAEVEKIMQDQSIAKEAKRPKIQETVQAGMDQIKAKLTPEQKEKLEAAQQERRKNAKEGDGAGKRGPKDGEGAKKGPRDEGGKKPEGGDKN
jgi:Spy/CpxP family protein refolding chaperone